MGENMNFADLKKSLKDKICNNYLLTGSDMFLLNRAYNLILNACQITMPDFNLQVFNGDEVDMTQVVNSCVTMPMFDERKCVFVNASIKCNLRNIKELDKYFADINPTTVLVISAGENVKEFEPFKSHFEVVDCNKVTQSLVNGFVVSELNKYNKNITASALNMLFNFTLGDMSKIENEITKLVSFVGDNTTITDNDVAQIVTKSVEFQIFELTEALARKNSVKVYQILDFLKAKKDSYRTLISLIYNHFRRLFHVSVSKVNKSELSTMLGVKEFAVTKMYEQTKLFTKKQLKAINDLCMQLDFEVKQSQTNVETAVEYLVLTILNYK